jgi:putative chitinase
MNIDQLQKIMPLAHARAGVFLNPLNATMAEFEINTKERQASFLGQVAHESGQLLYVRELASGQAYQGRTDLGNINPGDGPKYKGRGLIQVTGRANYVAMMLALNIDCVHSPELLEEPALAARTAGWFWKTHGLNQLADAGDQKAVTKRINGGYNGLAERLAFFNKAMEVL